jgi:hypothetical protein
MNLIYLLKNLTRREIRGFALSGLLILGLVGFFGLLRFIGLGGIYFGRGFGGTTLVVFLLFGRRGCGVARV